MIVPKLLAALRQAPGPLTAPERAAMSLLARWNDAMTTGSTAASVWWTFWGDYIFAAFQPWWTAAHVPVGKDPAALSLSLSLSSWPTGLTEDLTAWTSGKAPPSAAFTLPSGAHCSAPQVMRSAFGAAAAHLATQLGEAPGSRTWGRLHTRYFPSLTGASGLGYGPRASSGDASGVWAGAGGGGQPHPLVRMPGLLPGVWAGAGGGGQPHPLVRMPGLPSTVRTDGGPWRVQPQVVSAWGSSVRELRSPEVRLHLWTSGIYFACL